MLKCFQAIMLSLCLTHAWAIDEVYTFEDSASQARFEQLTRQMKCAVCQSQALSESDVLIAKDMKKLIRNMVRQGQSDEAIKTYLVSRYGKEILLNPPVDGQTWLLWLGPFMLLMLMAAIISRWVKLRVRVT